MGLNQRERRLLDEVVNSNDNKALNLLFFHEEGKSMSIYEKNSRDAIRKKFDITEFKYKDIQFETLYRTAIQILGKAIIDYFRKRRNKFIEDGAPTGTHWTCFITETLQGYLFTTISNNSEKKRAVIEASLSITPFDEGRLIPEKKYTDIENGENDEGEDTIGVEIVHQDEDPDIKNKAEETLDILELKVEDTESVIEEGESSSRHNVILKELKEAMANNLDIRKAELLTEIIANDTGYEEYAKTKNLDINGLYRDIDRAKRKLIVAMVGQISKRMKKVFLNYCYLLDEQTRSLLHDVIVDEVMLKEAGRRRGMTFGEVSDKFAIGYKVIINEYHTYLEYIDKERDKIDREEERKYRKYKKALEESYCTF